MQILYKDEYLVAIDKPAGMFVHRTELAGSEVAEFAMVLLRDQLGQWVYPAHRLDRPTSGALLFALSPEIASNLQYQFSTRSIKKEYMALVRGFCPEEGKIENALSNDDGKLQTASTFYKRLKQIELPIPNAKFDTSRYSIVNVQPHTGRKHQIRKHFAKIRHYLIGDTTHGDLHQNRNFAQYTGITGLMLHATKLTVSHPITNESIEIKSQSPERFEKLLHKVDSN